MGRRAIVATLCSYLLVCLIYQSEASSLKKRETTKNEIELLIVVDYSAYIHWYNRTPLSDTADQRKQKTFQNMKQYLGTILHTTNMVFKRLESGSINLQIQLVDIVFETQASESPWTETIKQEGTPKWTVNPIDALQKFKVESARLQKTIPHDYAIIYTGYGLLKDGKSSQGYAYFGHCHDTSVSIVSCQDSFIEASLMAHELGHSVGSDHDGTGNTCPADGGYVMKPGGYPNKDNKHWYWSTCSVEYIRTFLTDIAKNKPECLSKRQNDHPNQDLQQYLSKPYGQVYTADQQCIMKYGEKSYFARDYEAYNNGYAEMCSKFYCRVFGKAYPYYYAEGVDGIPCGKGKWCLSNECVTSDSVPEVTDDCPVGDQEGEIEDGNKCPDVLTKDPAACNRQDIKRKCCKTCAGATLQLPSGDAQCRRLRGESSHICRSVSTYADKTYAEVACAQLMCKDPSTNMCWSYKADDRTSCAQKKWCMNGVCVQDDAAPDVPDNCPWGDQPGTVTNDLTCAQIALPANSWRCYHSSTQKICCETCSKLKTDNPDCLYGDKSGWCATNIAKQEDAHMCNYGSNKDLCCGACGRFT